MGKRNFLIAILIGIVIIFGVVVWAFLRPALQASAENSRLNNDAWKLERVAGTWASEDEKTIIDIDGYDFTLKIDGVYALIATFSFDAATQSQDFDARFDMQIDPDSCIYPDANGASACELDEMWYEDGTIYVILTSLADGTQSEPIRLLWRESFRPGWA
ncbi:MAG: hypothetical protein PUD57_00190 [Clostridiales bacterium]|nr:hypothetical protein [Clostridiales bacterium]